MIDTDLLRSCGEALYGSRWQTDLAAALDVSDRQVRRWAAGAPIPRGVWIDIMRTMQERAAALDELVERARRHA